MHDLSSAAGPWPLQKGQVALGMMLQLLQSDDFRKGSIDPQLWAS